MVIFAKQYVDEIPETLDSFKDAQTDISLDSDRSDIPCSAVHTLERDMPDFDYSHLVDQLRDRVLKDFEDNAGIYSMKDIEKLKADDWFPARFLLRQKLDVDNAFDMMRKALRFKHESLCNSIRRQDFPAEFYMIGGLFAYEPDRKGNQMLYIRVKAHRKVPEVQQILQAFLYYTIQHLDEQADGRGISLVFDCTGGGYANADMDLLFFLITVLLSYFPKGMSYMLVHELPWILKPFWAIAKNWIPQEYRQLIKFSDSKTIYEYIEKENLPDFMGGTCTRDYRAAPENCTSLKQACKLWGLEPKIAKKVALRFADNLPPGHVESLNLDEELDSSDLGDQLFPLADGQDTPVAAQSVVGASS